MEQNIYQVVKEIHLDELLTNNMQTLAVIMLSSKTCGPCKRIKPKFVDLSKQNKDTLFIYIDIDNYEVINNKYFQDYKNVTPTFVFYFGGVKIAFIEGAHDQSLIQAITFLKQKIEDKKQEIMKKEKILETQKIQELQDVQININQNNDNNDSAAIGETRKVSSDVELLNKKMDLLNKLRELAQKGVSVSKYDLNSDYNQMLYEYQLKLNVLAQQLQPQPQQQQQQQQPQQPQQQQHELNNQDLKKQEQVKKIQELDKLHQRMQMQSFQKLQQLKMIQMMKEQQEKNKGQNQ